MATPKRPLGLGKGLSAIFETETLDINTPAVNSYEIEISKIHPNMSQPRTEFDEDAIKELSASIKRLGIIQPLTVREDSKGYEIISGERRYRAAKMAGLDDVPAYVRKVDDTKMLEMALVENVQREELGALEIALTLRRLTEELGVTQSALAESIGKRRSTVSNYLRLLTLCPTVQDALRSGAITMGHAKVIASLEGNEEQEALLAKIIENKLSVRGAEELLQAKDAPKSIKKKAEEIYGDQNRELAQLFGKNVVKIDGKTKGRGRITIKFASSDELEQFIGKLKYEL